MTISVRQESFIQDVTVTPTAATFGHINKPLDRYSVTCTLKQTTFTVLSSYDNEHGNPTKPISSLIRVNEHRSKESLSMSYVPCCEISMEIMGMSLRVFLQVATNKDQVVYEDEVIERIQHETKINRGYNSIRPANNNNNNNDDDQLWPEKMWLNVTINLVNVDRICVPREICARSLKRKRVDDECSICLEQMGGDEKELLNLYYCGHSFHQSCVIKWLTTSRGRGGGALSCPLCRGRVTGVVLAET